MLGMLAVLTVAAAGVFGGAWEWSTLAAGSEPAPWLPELLEAWGFGLQLVVGSARGTLAGCTACVIVSLVLGTRWPDRVAAMARGLDAGGTARSVMAYDGLHLLLGDRRAFLASGDLRRCGTHRLELDGRRSGAALSGTDWSRPN